MCHLGWVDLCSGPHQSYIFHLLVAQPPSNSIRVMKDKSAYRKSPGKTERDKRTDMRWSGLRRTVVCTAGRKAYCMQERCNTKKSWKKGLDMPVPLDGSTVRTATSESVRIVSRELSFDHDVNSHALCSHCCTYNAKQTWGLISVSLQSIMVVFMRRTSILTWRASCLK